MNTNVEIVQNAVGVKVNGKTVETQIWNNSETDLSEYLSVGENIIELILTNNLRNLLGFHHLQEGGKVTL